MMVIKDTRVLITGASSGIGKALAFELAERKARLVIASRRLDRLQEVAGDIKRAFPDNEFPLVISCDVTKREEVRRLVKESVDHFGGIDILVNNAGIGVYGPGERTGLEDIRSVMEVNFFGAIHCLYEVLPRMKKTGKGLIVNIASVAAKHGVPYLGAYCASKSALTAMSQSFRAELAKSGISFLIVFPGYTQTEFFKNEKKVGRVHRPQGPYVSVQKVAKAIIRAIEKEKKNLVLSIEGKALTLLQNLMPWLVERTMEKIAIQLRD